MDVRLVTNDLRMVHEATIPPFNEPPKVLLWGIRVFLLRDDAKRNERFEYAEVFATHVVT